MIYKKCNWKTDLQLAETFYTLSEKNTLKATPIPDESIDFKIVYRVEHDRRYTVSRTGGIYKGCKKIDDNTLAVFIPLSHYNLGVGALLRELYMQVPNNDFEGNIRNICVPSDTKYFLWEGPSENEVVIASDIITATIIKGNTGNSAYEDAVKHGYEGTEEEYALWPIIQGDYAKEQAGIAQEAALAAGRAADNTIAAINRTETAINKASEATNEARQTITQATTAIGELQVTAEKSAEQTARVEALADHPPRIVTEQGNNYWAFWDEASQQYVTSSYRSDDGMLLETPTGADVALDVVGGREYICGTLTSLRLVSVAASPRLSIIRFSSGAAPTEFTYPDSLPITGWTIPQAETTYDLFIWQGAATIVYR